MSLLFNVLFAWKCKSTHHKLALDALTQLRGPDALRWQNLFLKNIEPYLEGSKAPDDRFKDFRNHVLHVAENNWGGAVAAAAKWYAMTLESLRSEDWTTAVYRAGVLSHYYTDPIQPFHTGQSDAEGNIHRAAEWSIAQGYDELRQILLKDLGGWPEVTVPGGSDWLARMVTAGAEAAHPHYQPLIDHYDVHVGVKNPPAGMDQEFKDRIARLIGHAAVGFARILEKCFTEAAAEPPNTSVTLDGVLSALAIPIHFVTKRMADGKERAIVEAAYRELQATGRVKNALTEDDRSIRQLHTTEVLKTTEAALDSKPIGPTGAKYASGAPARGATVKRVATRLESPPARTEAKPTAPATAPQKPAVAATTAEKKSPPPAAAAPAAVKLEPPKVEPPKVEAPKVEASKPVPVKAELPKVESPKVEPAKVETPKPAPAPAAPPASVVVEAPKPVAAKPEPVPVPAPDEPVVETPKPRNEPSPAILKVVGPDKPLATEAAEPKPSAPVISAPPATPKSAPAPEPAEPAAKSPPPKPAAEPIRETAAPAKTNSGRGPRFYLDMDDPIVDAPSIGPKTADRLQAAGIRTVADFLDADIDALAKKLNQKQMAADVLMEWQQQAALMIRVPELRGHDVQILVACGITEPEDLLSIEPENMLDLTDTFCMSPEGERVLRDSKPPDLEEIQEWVVAAAQARPLPEVRKAA
jgi:predicted flap endonuclease-1-like 5' DNA nuclease